MNGWHEMKLDIPGEWRRFVIEASRGGRTVEEDEGDISVDDFTLELSRCAGLWKNAKKSFVIFCWQIVLVHVVYSLI